MLQAVSNHDADMWQAVLIVEEGRANHDTGISVSIARPKTIAVTTIDIT